MIKRIVDQPLHPVVLTDHAEDIESITKIIARLFESTALIRGGIGLAYSTHIPVQRAMDGIFPSPTTNHFHNVELTTIRPADLLKIGTQRPKGGPNSLATWQGRANIDAAKAKLHRAFGLDSRRGKATTAPIFFFRGDH